MAELEEEDIGYMSEHSGKLSESVYHNDGKNGFYCSTKMHLFTSYSVE